MFKVGPIGSSETFDMNWDEKGGTMITNIYVSFNDYHINSLQFSYLQNGVQVVSEKHGSSEGKYFQIIRLNPDEYVTGLSGTTFCKSVTSLTFYTNQRKHGPICTHCSSSYFEDYKREIDVKIRDRSEFGGFFGSFSEYGISLTSIGIYVSPNYQTNSDQQLSLYNQPWDDPLATTNTDNHRRLDDYQTPKFVDNRTLDDYQTPKFVDNQTLDDYQTPKTLDDYQTPKTVDDYQTRKIVDNWTLDDYQTPKIVDGFPVKRIGHKPKLKDRIKAIWNLFKDLLD